MKNQHTLTFFPELEASASRSKEPDSKRSVSLRLIDSVDASLGKIGHGCQISEMSETLPRLTSGKEALLLLQEDFRVNLSRRQAAGVVIATKGSYGQSALESCAKYDRASHSLRTFQGCLQLTEDEPSTEFLATWSRSGMIASGILFQLPPLVRLTSGTEFGFWPTPSASDGPMGGGQQSNGGTMAARRKEEEWPQHPSTPNGPLSLISPETASRVLALDDGLPRGAHAIKAAGNAIVPQVAEIFAQAIYKAATI